VRFPVVLLSWILSVAVAASASAQFKQADAKGPKLGEAQVVHWLAGMTIKASAGECKGVEAYVPIPVEWPEQEVKPVKEDVSPSAKVEYQMADGGVRVMVIRIASLPANEEAKAMATFEIRRTAQLAPADTSIYVAPNKRKLERSLLPYLGASPFIEPRQSKIKSLSKKIGADKKHAWEQVEAFYDYVRENIKQQQMPVKGPTIALKDGVGSHEDMVNTFVALCRAKDIPARTVWVPGHSYAEFYLDDDEGKGHWFPCQVAGARSFGAMPDKSPILQKGDNIRPPYDKREQQRYMAVHVKVADTAAKPTVTFTQKLVSE
jgi:hypothetical protein